MLDLLQVRLTRSSSPGSARQARPEVPSLRIGKIPSMTQPDNPDAIRVGDREREQAISVLHDAVGGGYLDLQEFEERSQTVYAAKTRGDLRASLADLPAGAQLFPPIAPPGAVGASVMPKADTINVDWTTVKRRGSWQVPAHLVVTGSLGTADLDLSRATIPLTGCLIEVLASWSTVKLRLGGSIVARTEDFDGGSMTTLKDKAGPPSTPGGPVIDIRGHANWTTVVLRRN